MKEIIISFLLLIQVVLVTAQTGTIKGTVHDSKTNESLIGTTVYIKGSTQGTITDFDGNYIISKVTPGNYTLAISFISYDPQEFQIEVKANEEIVVDVALAPATLEIEGVEVVAKANRESESMLLVEQKNAVLATQAIGAQEISRKGASDAEAAVTKVSGISKQDGVKNVFVRGLGDRFNSTTLNGFPVPSEDPEYKNISLDFFASDIIKTVGVNKVFNAGLTGDVAGAEINISSKELIGDGEFSMKVSSKANNNTLTQDFLVTDGVNALGFVTNTSSPTNEDIYGFPNSLDPSTRNFQLGKEIGFGGGKQFEFGPHNNPLSFYVVGNYSSDFNYLSGIMRGTTTSGDIFQDQTSDEFEIKTAHLAMANLNYGFNKYELSYNFMVVHTAKLVLSDDYGMHADFQSVADLGYIGLIRRQQNNDNTLLVNQLSLEREFSKRLSANIGMSFNHTKGLEPDRRLNYLADYGNDVLKPVMGTGRQQRYYSVLNENDLNTQASIAYKLKEDEGDLSFINVGYKGRMVNDDFEASEWDNSRLDGNQNLPSLDKNNIQLDLIFNQDEFEKGKFANDEFASAFSVDKYIHSLYSELVYPLGRKLVLNAGVRADIVDLTVEYDVNRGSGVGSSKLEKFYLLPSFNLKYGLNEKNALRLGASRTYTLPQSKEISPFRYTGRQWSSQGNPNLRPSTNYNVDLKWDYYMSRDELVSVTVFGKLIQDPISRIEKASAGGFLTYENIADQAIIGGVEVEIRKNLLTFSNEETNAGTKLSTGVNFSYIKTDVEVNNGLNFTNNKTQLEGASPVLANADLSFQHRRNDLDLTTSLVAAYFSDRIYTIGAGGYQDINEAGITSLDFISSIKFGQHWGVSIKALNLLNPTSRLTREPNGEGAEPVVLKSYQKAVSTSLGLSYRF
ncbi:TonB-dependent receptor [Prolixibacteraceae bacterium Z1-6]|uniref:TonB-dependent receptor n=1 Tax=Draconibacterium aestuarii TaxID=2998507 RepID=A0A9X3J9A9_9BACT|nr:TonB-dependent receptor [Prolixibacteraceae bacterium Z1-6]